MAVTVKDGMRASGIVTLHSGPGRLLGYQISHSLATAQAVIFFDGASTAGARLMVVYVHPSACPVYVRFGVPPGKEEGLSFSRGLTVNAGNCEVNVWSIGYD